MTLTYCKDHGSSNFALTIRWQSLIISEIELKV